MSEPKNHHLLPRFYLSGFCDPEDQRSKGRSRDQCRLWVHDWQQGCIEERTIKKLTVRRHYYSADTRGGGRDAGPEKVLAELEDRVAPILRSLRPGWQPGAQEKVLLAHFAALMKFRVSGYRPWALRYAEENEAEIRGRVFPDPEALREDLRRHGQPEAEDPETVERVFRDIHSVAYELTLTKNHMLERMFSIGAKAAGALLRRDWVFGWAPEGASFVTSDDPFVLMDPALGPPAGYMGDVGFAVARALALLPLTQKTCLVAFGEGGGVHHLKYSRKDVRDINIVQTKHYERWLIARHKPLLERLVG
ncbi:DUF4238 domain-containing protein [Rubrobacter marinus]|uniref:DUF4238 domain-containing protein n=1 Tax=Rubrobacter marinus TaxID=2653852 RepID=A0A6G8PVQ6_9ACTN|nr:DUF4238 domain-containing protein [Rubrobacter marinus]QIN78290.1 DUF4238 domain-containing protein [Rubrobacter marinus]